LISKIGLHIRLTSTLTEVIEKALRLNVPFFQTFFIYPSGKYIKFEKNDVFEFLRVRNKYFQNLYLHGSYWINLCNPNIPAYKVLKKEILMAKKLEFTHLVLHPGAATGCKDKTEGIEFLAKALNRICKEEQDIKIILENTAHANSSIGGDINDFKILMNYLKYPEKILYCIDSAHAYSWGYDLSNFKRQEEFIKLINETIPKENLALIHLNDTNEKLSSKIDKHCIPGKGNIGKEALIRFLKFDEIKDIPILIEPPTIDENEEKLVLHELNKWIA